MTEPHTPANAALPCHKCGAPAEVVKAGSSRHWVQCSRFGKNGNCNVIGRQTDARKTAIATWNAMVSGTGR
jgi:hypothetical protein